MNVRVECYSGYKADERPIRFQVGERLYTVEEVVDQWYGPGDTWFRVRADDGSLYVLRHHQGGNQDTWELQAFRR